MNNKLLLFLFTGWFLACLFLWLFLVWRIYQNTGNLLFCLIVCGFGLYYLTLGGINLFKAWLQEYGKTKEG